MSLRQTGKQTAENLKRDKCHRGISGYRQRDREERSYIGISRKRERGREEKSKSRDLSNRSLKTDGETESGEPT